MITSNASDKEALGMLSEHHVQSTSAMEHLRLAGSRLSNILHDATVDPSKFSKQALNNLDTLASLASTLELPDVQQGSYQTALFELMVEEDEHIDSVHHLTRLRDDLQKNVASLEADTNFLNRWTKSHEAKREIEEHVASTWDQNAIVLQQKSEEYMERLNVLQGEWTADKEAIRWPVLEELEREFDCIQEAYEDDVRLLKSYQDLPPDLTLARIKLSEREVELASLIETKTKLLDDLFQ
ncbi:hypothetical protein SeMB42_g05593 [Synchytrium endobioticum]|uniref:Uncharacterized protein n=1 Tax=Synchytrium endobioticum TaxID=286115 RepID=A0A507CVA9_9FUNG|nr:hypothetical protein SeMB42_g05593 [Synchytrium endobioticum]TPX43065.1 hypothetical protein SeLEV6574_g05261 [Synchytrium endobioticum]